jgi:hypothetical protein
MFDTCSLLLNLVVVVVVVVVCVHQLLCEAAFRARVLPLEHRPMKCELSFLRLVSPIAIQAN